MPPGTHAHKLAEAKKSAFLAFLAGGRSKGDALREMGVPQGTYARWRIDDKDFKARVDGLTGLKAAHRDQKSLWHGSVAEGRKRFFGYDTYYHHHKIIEAVESTPPMGITLVLLPPEHGKTTVVGDLISLKLGQDPLTRIAYVSEGLGLARKAARRQKNRMTVVSADNAAYIARYGPFHDEGSDKPWTADYFVVEKANHDEQDYSFEARGWKSSIAGSRVDWLIIDDIQSRKSLNATTEMLETFRQDFISRVGSVGRIIIIGTRVGEEDIYQALIDEGIVNRIVMLPATEVGDEVVCPLVEARYVQLLAGRADEDLDVDVRVDLKIKAQRGCDAGDGSPPRFPDGTPIPHERPLCPEMWDAHQLAVRRGQVGEIAWWRNYQQNPRRAGDLTFTELMMEDAKDLMRVVGERTLVRERHHHQIPTMRLCGLDPSLTGGNALTVADATYQTFEILDCEIKFNLARTEAILERVLMMWKRHHFEELVIEVNAFQKALGNDERLRAMSLMCNFRIRPHTTGLNKLDETLGVAKMATSFSLAELRIPYGDPNSRDVMAPLINQLLAWRPLVATRKIRQDLVMSTWFIWLYWMHRRVGLLEIDGNQDWMNVGREGSPFYVGPAGRPKPVNGSPFYAGAPR